MADPARNTAVARHRADMEHLLNAARRVASQRRDEPVYRVWTLPDLLAHVAAWDRWLIAAVDELLAGKRPRFGRTSVFNKHAVDASRAQTYAEIVRNVRGAHRALMARLERLSDEEWSRESRHRYNWGDRSPITVASLFAYKYQGRTHYGGHADEIEEWVRDKG